MKTNRKNRKRNRIVGHWPFGGQAFKPRDKVKEKKGLQEDAPMGALLEGGREAKKKEERIKKKKKKGWAVPGAVKGGGSDGMGFNSEYERRRRVKPGGDEIGGEKPGVITDNGI